MGVDLGRKRKRQVSGLPNELGHRQYPPHPNPWAEDDSQKYWAAADAGERANGRLYREVEFALTRELNAAERVEVASSFAKHLTGEERLPYTLTIHRGGEDGGNPHAHLMFSERTNDGIERSAERRFKRYNAQEPEKGGARKSTPTKPWEWLENTREQWADHANEALERAGRSERITEASLENQYWEAAEAGNEREMARLQGREPGVHIGPHNVARAMRGEDLEAAEAGNEREMARLQGREPGVHIGPHNVARAMRGEDLDRVVEAGDAVDRNRVRWIEGALARVEQQIREVTQQIAEQVRETWNRGAPISI